MSKPVLASLVVLGCAALPAVDIDPALPDYVKVAGISGNLNSIGSDTLNNVMAMWAEGFSTYYPNVVVQAEGKGSTTAPPALIEGTSQLGPMSREMNPKEVDAFEAKYHYKPTAIKVAIDALAVFVHKDNPADSLTLQQVDAIFSRTRKRGAPADLADWGQVVAAWQGKPISIYGRNSASGTYGYFKEHALAKGDYKPTVKEQPGTSAVVQGVASDLAGIGYGGIGYLTSGVKALKIADKGQPVAGTYESCLDGTYPMARFLYVYVNQKPGEALPPLVGEFIRYVQSKQGQEVVVKDGYFPLKAEMMTKVAGK